MALKKSIMSEFGVPAEYWHIGAKQEDFRGGGLDVTMFGYASQEARTVGRNPMSVARFTLTGQEYSPDMAREVIYAAAKNRPEFAGAEDC